MQVCLPTFSALLTATPFFLGDDMTIKWISGNDGTPGCGGYWDSADGRFSISPYYRHTVNPDGYKVRDNSDGTTYSVDRVRDAKAWALKRMNG